VGADPASRRRTGLTQMTEPVEPLRILVADDHAAFRDGLTALLATVDDITVVGQAGSGEAVVAGAAELQPDVVLMDLNMPEMSGLEATPIIRKNCPDTRVIALTVHDNKEYVLRILRSGASGYVLKDTSPEELVKAIEAVAHGEAFFSPRISNIVLQDISVPRGINSFPPASLLSAREMDVLRAIAIGKTSKEVAAALELSVRTVETYRVRIKRKLNARNTAELLNEARQQQLL
jgi:two-component system nitrate/nitrite response regulator NarL